MNKNEQDRNTGFPPSGKCVMAPGGKDIAQVAYRTPKEEVPDPPITQRIRLPEIVSVRYLAEILADATVTPFWIMVSRLSFSVALDRSISFQEAVRMLRKFGIDADLEP